MRDLVFAIPGDLDTPTGGYEYARQLLAHLPAAGVTPRVLGLPTTFPNPTAGDLEATAAAFEALPPGVPLLVDGLAFGALPEPVIAAAGSRPLVVLVHHPLGLEEGLSPERRAALLDGERFALAMATRVVVTSAYTARLLAERFGVPVDRIDVARPGTERSPISDGIHQRRHAEKHPQGAPRSTHDSGASPDQVRGKLFETCSSSTPQRLAGHSLAPHPESLTQNSQRPHPEEAAKRLSRRTHHDCACFEGRHGRPPQHEEGRVSYYRLGFQDDDVGSVSPRSHEEGNAGSASATTPPIRLLAVGAVVPRKGYPLLIEALRPLTDLPWEMVIVGAPDRAPDHAAALRAQIDSAGLADRVVLAGAVSAADLARHFGEADALVSASLFEGYGMTLADSLARGLPIVMARAGAADETVPDDAALKVPPGDAIALSAALRRLITEPDTRVALAVAARAAGLELPGWHDTAAIVAGAIAKAEEERA